MQRFFIASGEPYYVTSNFVPVEYIGSHIDVTCTVVGVNVSTCDIICSKEMCIVIR